MENDVTLQDNVDQFESFLTSTQRARLDSERDRDYVDHKQWTAEEIEKLEARNQAPIVINKLKTKVNLLTGLQRQRRTDPKALPRTPKHEDDADAITESVRFVADNTDFDDVSSDMFEDKITWAYSAAIIVADPNKDFEVTAQHIPGDRFYFDPHARRLDFKDAGYMGIVLWMDEEDAVDTFPDKETEIRQAILASSSNDGETFEDKPDWVHKSRKRLRVCQHYFLHRGVWHEAYFTGNLYLVEPKPSPWLNEDGDPTNPIEADTCYITRENDRYGEIRAYIWAQQEINHRRSKALYDLSVRQTIGDEGAVEDVQTAKQELAKADGHVEVKPGRRFELLDRNDQTSGQFELYADAKAEIDAVGANAALGGQTEDQSLSGRAIQALQQGGIAELGKVFDRHSQWERRCYRQMWARIKQFWDEERWIRVTDDQDNLKWVTLNQPVTFGELLKERAEQGDQQAQSMLQQMLGDPRLNEVAEVRTNTTEMDVDIIMSQSVNYATIRQEQFETLANLAQAYGPEAVPFEALLALSDLPNKQEVEAILTPPEEEVDVEQQKAQAQLAADLAELDFRKQQAEAEKAELEPEAVRAKTQKDLADAEAQEIENEYVRRFGVADQNVALS